MKTEPLTTTKNESCPIGGCGTTKGMCPGIGLGIALLVSTVLTSVLQVPQWQIPLTIVLAVALIFGFYPTGGRWIPSKN